MATFKHLLVPTDFGRAAEDALELAISIADAFGASLTLIHAYTIPIAYTYEDGILWPLDRVHEGAKAELDAAVRRAADRLPHIRSRLIKGIPSDEILSFARTSATDLIVMGTHGRRGAARVLLGSVAEKVLRLSPVPVLTTSGQRSYELALERDRRLVSDHEDA